MIIVAHRGPVTFVRDERGGFRARRGSGGLAGSLGPAEIERLLPLAPDWFAVRGAACEGGRGGRVTEPRVRALVELMGAKQ